MGCHQSATDIVSIRRTERLGVLAPLSEILPFAGKLGGLSCNTDQALLSHGRESDHLSAIVPIRDGSSTYAEQWCIVKKSG